MKFSIFPTVGWSKNILCCAMAIKTDNCRITSTTRAFRRIRTFFITAFLLNIYGISIYSTEELQEEHRVTQRGKN
jgi:hypothetical protein